MKRRASLLRSNRTASVEEIDASPVTRDATIPKQQLGIGPTCGNRQFSRPLRDRLCLLINKHGLDANLVKLYAADFCGTEGLRQASREQVAEFVTHLAQYAQHDRDGLLCRLNR